MITPKRYVLAKVVQYHQLAKMEKERDTLRTHLDFAKDELNQLRTDIKIMKQQSNLSIPDPMDIFTDQDLLKIAEAWGNLMHLLVQTSLEDEFMGRFDQHLMHIAIV